MTQMTQIFNFFNPRNLGNLWLKVFLPKKQEVVWVDTSLALVRLTEKNRRGKVGVTTQTASLLTPKTRSPNNCAITPFLK